MNFASDCLATTGLDNSNIVTAVAVAALLVVTGFIALRRSGRVLLLALAVAVPGSLLALGGAEPSFASQSCSSDASDAPADESEDGDDSGDPEDPTPPSYAVTVTINSVDTLIGTVAELGYMDPDGGFSGWITMSPAETETYTIGDPVDGYVQFSISLPGTGSNWSNYTISTTGDVSVSLSGCGTVNGVGYVDNQGCTLQFAVSGSGTVSVTYLEEV